MITIPIMRVVHLIYNQKGAKFAVFLGEICAEEKKLEIS